MTLVRIPPSTLVVVALAAGCGDGGSEPPTDACPAGDEKSVDGRCRPVDEACPDGTTLGAQASCVPPGCAPGTWDVDGACLTAGVDNAGRPCPPGHYEDLGRCVPAGVPPEACPDGFVASDGGCAPELPDGTCPSGTMAVLGATECQPITDCGSAPWGHIDLGPDTQYVSASFAGVSDGSSAAPWTTLDEAVQAAAPGAVVAVGAGSYDPVQVVGDKPIRLWGRCPQLVEIVVPGGGVGILLTGPVTGTEIRGFAIQGGLAGLVVSDATGVTARDLWLHDLVVGVSATAFFGVGELRLQSSLAEDIAEAAALAQGGVLELHEVHAKRTNRVTAVGGFEVFEDGIQIASRGELTVRRSVVEQPTGSGVGCFGCTGRVEESAILDGQPGDTAPGIGIGISPASADGALGELVIDRVFIARATSGGIVAGGAVVDVTNTTIVDTQPDPETHAGHGVHFGFEAGTLTTDGSVSATLVESSVANGMLLVDGETQLRGVLVRKTAPYLTGPNQGFLGIGAQVQVSDTPGARSEAWFTGCHFEGNAYAGLLAIDAAVHVTDGLFAGTRADASGLGVGLAAASRLGAPLELEVSGSLIEASVGVGLLAAGANITLEATTVRDTGLAEAEVGSASGIMIEHSPNGATSTATLERVLVERSHDVGIAVFGSDARLEGCLIDATAPDDSGRFGDGLLVSSDVVPADVSLDGVAVLGNARAAVANFGGTTRYRRSRLACHTFDLDGEPGALGDFSFVDEGGNACGCPEARTQCTVVTADLDAPAPIPLQ